MRAVRWHEYGGPEVLRLEDLPRPEPGPGELLIEVTAAGVTLPGVRLTHRSPDGGGVPLPYAPGGEVAGRVAALGPGVTGWRAGQRVTGLAFAGSYAEFALAPAPLLFPVPDGVDDLAALTLVRSGQVALGTLRAAGSCAGQSVLVTGAASGVGHLAVQLAVALGAARVLAAIGPAAAAEKADLLRGLGAERVLTYAELAESGEQVHVVLDGVGGEVLPACLGALAPLGRLVSYNGVGGTVEVNDLRMRATSVIGFAMSHLAAGQPEVYRRHRDELWELHRAGSLRPVIHAALPLEQAGQAHRIIESRTNLGKVVLLPR